MLGGDQPQKKRRVKVDMEVLEIAFDDASPEVSTFLDLETGEVVRISYEVRRELDKIYQEIYGDEDEPKIPVEAAIEKSDVPEWMKEAIAEADLVESRFDERFIRIPEADSHEGYKDMEAFVETVVDIRLRNLLELAIDGPGAFRRVKDVLERYPRERERWFQFKSDRLRLRILEWLEDEGIEPVS